MHGRRQELADGARPRDLLSQLLCFAGEYDRADSQLKALETQFSDRKEATLLLRNLIAGAQVREKFYAEGWLPEFVENPPEYLQLHLKASIALREGQAAEAQQLLGEAEEQRPELPGTCDGQKFEDFRDTDDLTSSFLEVLTSSGKYYWIPFERIKRLSLQPAPAPIDVLWRAARIDVRNGLQGIVYLPQLYEASSAAEDPILQLGQSTEWIDDDDAPTRGVGHRIFYFNGEFHPW